MNKQFILIASIVALLLSSCGDGKKARTCLDKAKAMYENKQFIAAKSVIDSINLLYPKEIEIRKEALTLMRKVECGESEQNIAYCDSLLPIRVSALDSLKNGFVFEKDSAYDETGNYVWKTMTVERNVQRSYIRCGVSEDGEMYMASVYFGSRPIEHTGLKLTAGNDTYAETPSIPYDGGVNYRFKDLGNTTEVVTYKGENCKAIANYVYMNGNARIKAEYKGGKPYSLYLSNNDKKGINATYELALVLSEINAIKKEKVKSEKKIQIINNKLNNNN